MTLAEILELPQPLSDEHRRLVHARMLENMAELGAHYITIQGQVRKKPLLGGIWGAGRYVLCSRSGVSAGLDRVTYFVMEEQTWLVVGLGDSVADAIAYARETLAKFDPSVYARFVASLAVRRVDEAKELARVRDEERAAWLAQRKSKSPVPPKSIPKRRREIFEASDGKCHYCGDALALDGKWHIEHKMPKALLGSNDRANLVASCVTCNHQKRDMTAEEFIAKRASA